jgi:hypothetical protein
MPAEKRPYLSNNPYLAQCHQNLSEMNNSLVHVNEWNLYQAPLN